MSATINTFPPFQSMSSPRGWILAAIVLLHLAFFYVLSAGLVPNVFMPASNESQLVVIDSERIVEPQPLPKPVDVRPEAPPIFAPVPPQISDSFDHEPMTAPRNAAPEAAPFEPQPIVPRSVLTEPQVDPRLGLSEPSYPSGAIRRGLAGTVVLSVYVLENGRVGDVRVDQSSGHSVLDESAIREARTWRFKPGMRDGVAVAMWKQIPITFQLREGARF